MDQILLDSARKHGIEAAGRYSLLLRTAMAAVGYEPALPGSVAVPRIPGIRAYPVRLSRRRVETSRRVREPRHIIVYRVGADGIVEVVGIVHDKMVLSRAARRALRELDGY
jgi:toxin ParE1/3/4